MVLAWVQKSVTLCHVAISEQYLEQGGMVLGLFLSIFFFVFIIEILFWGFFPREIIMFEASTWFLRCTWVLSTLCSHKGKHTHLIWIYSNTDCISCEWFGGFFSFSYRRTWVFFNLSTLSRSLTV